MNYLLLAFIISMGINLIMFVPAFMYKTDKLTDLSYSITFVALVTFGYYNSAQNNLDKLILVLVLAWAVRLGGFLFIRIKKIGRDVRFDDKRDHFFPFLKFWLLQGAAVFVVMLSALIGFEQEKLVFSLITLLGILVFLLGLVTESIADVQKFRFNSEVKNKGKWIDTGIWRASRHPNYLGEMMVWVGMFLLIAPYLSALGILVALLSPLFIIGLLLFVSGIPLLERSSRKKWGSNKEFDNYLLEVPILIPTIRSIKRINSRS